MKKLIYGLLICLVIVTCLVVATTDNSDSGSHSSGSGKQSFTNKYGTSSTVCAVSGCSRTIVSSGDSNCCSVHSNRCGKCNKYIDGDAMFCMDCIRNYLN